MVCEMAKRRRRIRGHWRVSLLSRMWSPCKTWQKSISMIWIALSPWAMLCTSSISDPSRIMDKSIVHALCCCQAREEALGKDRIGRFVPPSQYHNWLQEATTHHGYWTGEEAWCEKVLVCQDALSWVAGTVVFLQAQRAACPQWDLDIPAVSSTQYARAADIGSQYIILLAWRDGPYWLSASASATWWAAT